MPAKARSREAQGPSAEGLRAHGTRGLAWDYTDFRFNSDLASDLA